jgi:Uma2 family endonuclease
MATNIKPLMTIADLEAMPDDGNRYEIIEGELFVSCAPGLTHQRVLGNLLFLIGNYLRQNPIGEIISTPGLILSEFSGVIPDLVFFTREMSDNIISNERLVAAPAIVVEIFSPGAENTRRDRVAKPQLYAKHRVAEYWIVDFAESTVEVLTGESLGLEIKLKGDDILTSTCLPGFSCPTDAVFETFPWKNAAS